MTTYTFLGVPAIHVIKKLYEEGRIGQAYFLNMQFLHGARLQEVMNDPRSVWRFNADESGKAGTVGDLGTHLESIARFLFGAMSSVLARLLCEPNGIELDSVNNVLFKVEGGLCGSMQIAQLACGHNTDMAFEIWGDKGTLAWSYKKPDEIRLYCLGAEDKVILASDMICNNDLINLANPEIKEGVDSHTAAFRRIYEGYITAVNADPEQAPFFPDFDLGAAGVEFVDACLESQKNGNTWITLK
jgi:predicted dehydrogenase